MSTAVGVNDVVAETTGTNFIQDTVCQGNQACYAGIEIGSAVLGLVGPSGAAHAAETVATHADDALHVGEELAGHADDISDAVHTATEAEHTAEAAADVDKAGDVGETVTATQEVPQYVYRGGSAQPDAMTPRPGIDDVPGEPQGLSAWKTPEQAGRPGDKVQIIDTTQLHSCTAVCDTPDGHISIVPSDGTSVTDWALTRGTGAVDPHTQDVINAIVGMTRIPKQ